VGAAAGPHPAYVALSASVPGCVVAVVTAGAGCRAATELQLQGQIEDLPAIPVVGLGEEEAYADSRQSTLP
jgi:hypothetical protein